jgi:hypothetical protein
MALEQVSTYIFTPSITPTGGQQYAATLAIPGRWNIGQIRRIVNATRNKLMYSDENEKLIGTIAFNTYNQTVPTGMPSTLVQKAGGVTTFNLLMDTSYMQASDVLEVLVEKKEQIIRPFDFGTDAIERIRVSDPKSMIDADFEYGLQPTKWASYGLNRYFPSIFELQSNDLIVSAIVSDGTTTSNTNSLIVVTTLGPHGIATARTPIHIAGTSQTIALGVGGADGGFLVETVVNPTQFTYRAKTVVTSGSILADNIVLRRCIFSSNSEIPIQQITTASHTGGTALTVSSAIAATLTNSTSSGTTITVTSTTGLAAGMQILITAGTGTLATAGNVITAILTATTFSVAVAPTVALSAATVVALIPHNLVPGTPLLVRVVNGTNTLLANGSFFVDSVPAPGQFTFTPRQDQTTNTINFTSSTTTITANSDGLAAPRPWDGGVQIYTASASNGASIVRMTKKYNRYQSGKGYLWSSGVLFRPNYDIRSITANGTAIGSLVTVVVDGVPHGLQATSSPALGATVTIAGVGIAGYNGTFTVNSILSPYSFTYLNTVALGATTGTSVPGTDAKAIVPGWSGAVVRAGPFDDQNGMFFEYDGATFWAVRRSAVFQIAGSLAINTGSTVVFGTNTRFLDQVRAGDKIVIKGMTYLVSSVTSNTTMLVSPDYRPTISASGVKGSIVRETRISSANWNIDTCDGSGNINNPSGFQLDLNTMQMVGIQYTWYGAGFIDWMIRGADGNWIMVHRLKNNNVNYEAHMRTGNLPVRYSVENEGAYTHLTGSLTAAANSASVISTADFPNTGVLLIDQEIISYSGKTATSFTGLTRAATLSKFQGGSTRNFTGSVASSHDVPSAANSNGVGVTLIRNTCSPSLVHWGSALVMDGGFDSDRGYIFNTQRTIDIQGAATSTNKKQAFALRLAPSVSAGILGVLGSRDLINRAQFLLDTIGVDIDNAANARAIIVEGIVNPTNLSFLPVTLTGGSSSGTTITVASTASLSVGMTVAVTAGTGVFAVGGNVVVSIPSATTFTVAVAPSTTLSGATITATGGWIDVNSVAQGSQPSFAQVSTAFVVGSTGNSQNNTGCTGGETIFSFALPVPAGATAASSGAVNDRLGLTSLKELTNSPIGGDGVYPDGPEVLVIQLSMVGTGTGTASATVLCRWSEAQA